MYQSVKNVFLFSGDITQKGYEKKRTKLLAPYVIHTPGKPVLEVFWNLVKGELRQQLVSYAEGFNVDLMHQGEQKVEQYTNANRVT